MSFKKGEQKMASVRRERENAFTLCLSSEDTGVRGYRRGNGGRIGNKNNRSNSPMKI